jgi:hypothetical protein
MKFWCIKFSKIPMKKFDKEESLAFSLFNWYQIFTTTWTRHESALYQCRQAKGESESCSSHLTITLEQTNKGICISNWDKNNMPTWVICVFLKASWNSVNLVWAVAVFDQFLFFYPFQSRFLLAETFTWCREAFV